MKRCGFAWLEIIVVSAIVILLAALISPMIKKRGEYARWRNCASNLKTIGIGTMQYLSDNNDTYPRITNGTDNAGHIISWRTVVRPYLPAANPLDIWRCPSNPISSYASPYDGLPLSYDVADTGPIRRSKSVRSSQLVYVSCLIVAFEENGNNEQSQQLGVPWDKESKEPGWTNILFAGHYFGGMWVRTMYLFADGHVTGLEPKKGMGWCGIKDENDWNINIRAPWTPGALKKLAAARKNFR